jgi:hypothetical protein
MNPVLALNQVDQFVWLDHINRGLITGGGLQRLTAASTMMPGFVARSMLTPTSAIERSPNA